MKKLYLITGSTENGEFIPTDIEEREGRDYQPSGAVGISWVYELADSEEEALQRWGYAKDEWDVIIPKQEKAG